MTKDESNHRGTLTVSGNGEVKVKPNVASLTLGTSSRGKTAQQAVAGNAEIMGRVIAAIKGLGIAADAIQTSGLNLYPIIQQQEGSEPGQIVGYAADNNITVRVDVEMAGKVFDTGVQAGANQSNSLSFGLRDEAPARAQALQLAVKSAREEAQVAATAAGVRLQGPRSIDVSGGGPILFRSAEAVSGSATPVVPGLLTISARVSITYDYQYA